MATRLPIVLEAIIEDETHCSTECVYHSPTGFATGAGRCVLDALLGSNSGEYLRYNPVNGLSLRTNLCKTLVKGNT